MFQKNFLSAQKIITSWKILQAETPFLRKMKHRSLFAYFVLEPVRKGISEARRLLIHGGDNRNDEFDRAKFEFMGYRSCLHDIDDMQPGIFPRPWQIIVPRRRRVRKGVRAGRGRGRSHGANCRLALWLSQFPRDIKRPSKSLRESGACGFESEEGCGTIKPAAEAIPYEAALLVESCCGRYGNIPLFDHRMQIHHHT